MLTKHQFSKFKELFETKLKDPLMKNKKDIIKKGNEARISLKNKND